ncbi:MAG TPA: phosphoribosylglycinamide formyltransferase [Methanocorpusculum sp.]|nr:phosphoribosylglycinamide formyltransferase [Methanocorpusculum sp.]
MKRIAVLASGRGSNFQALIDAVEPLKINGKIIALITDNKDAYAVQRAKNADIPCFILNFKDYSSRTLYEDDLIKKMKELDADLYVCAGYMKIIGREIAKTFYGKLINIHPAILPSFPGLNAQGQAADYGVKIAGCTVHFVDEGVDTGPIIIQKAVPAYFEDDEESLGNRILEQEHIAYPEAVKLFCDDRLKIVGRKVQIL